MRLSTRDQLTGTAAAIEIGAVTAVVEVEVDLHHGQKVTASITGHAVEDRGPAVGGPVTALVTSTEVMIGVE